MLVLKLVWHIRKKKKKKLGKRTSQILLLQHPWEGNVRIQAGGQAQNE